MMNPEDMKVGKKYYIILEFHSDTSERTLLKADFNCLKNIKEASFKNLYFMKNTEPELEISRNKKYWRIKGFHFKNNKEKKFESILATELEYVYDFNSDEDALLAFEVL